MRRLVRACRGPDGSQLSVLDGSKLKFNRSDGSRILEVTPAGGFKVYAANGTTERVVVDGDGLDVGGGLVVVDETGLDIGSGLTVIDSTGVQVGTDVVIDSTGLHVDGGNVQAVWGFVHEELTENVTLGSTTISSSATNIHQIVIDPPDWVKALYVIAVADMLVQNSTGAPHRMDTRVLVDDGGASEDASTMSQQKEATGISRSVSVSQSLAIPLSPAGRSVTITQRGTLSGGSASTGTRFRLNVMALGVRSAFV